jgi:hypothetical protein
MPQLIRLLVGLAALAALPAVQVNAAPNATGAPRSAQKPSVDTLTCVVDYEIAAQLTSKRNPSEMEYFEAAAATATSALAKEKNAKPTDPQFMKEIQDYTQRTAKMLDAKQISREYFDSQLAVCDARFNP